MNIFTFGFGSQFGIDLVGLLAADNARQFWGRLCLCVLWLIGAFATSDMGRSPRKSFQ